MRLMIRLLLALVAVSALAAPGAIAGDSQPPLDINLLEYEPIGAFKPGDPVPPNTPLTPTAGKRFNPSGNYNAFDTNIYEVLNYPFRGAGDETTDDAPGNGGNPKHGLCAPNPVPRPGPEAPLSSIAGECPNHQLEYIDYYEETMRDILGDFGVTFRRYEFDNPGTGNTLAGRAINPAAIVPGAEHPDETIVVGAHYDKTTEAPAAAWDSQEGHAQVIRIAKIMADYWRATGTRPSATVKFIPWDAEESGTLGSLDYAQNNIVPGEEHEVRGYWNTDPCAGGYPAYRFGNPQDRVDLGIQLADPESIEGVSTARIEAFNAKAPGYLEDVFNHLDDTLTLDAGPREIFTSKAEAGDAADIGNDVNIGLSRPVLFSSDWRNFEVLGIPFFNPGPEVTGPDSNNNPNNPDALAILHTPNDNLNTLNAYAGRGPSQANGQTLSEGWAKGMEMCSQLLAYGMLQPDQGGTRASDPAVVAYYEALPNEAIAKQKVGFDARGSYQYESVATRQMVPEDRLEYLWEFGDGATATGRQVQHAYDRIGIYTSKLTVRNRETGQTDEMSVPITVIGPNFRGPVLLPAPDTDEDGSFPLEWTFESDREGFERFVVEEAPDFQVLFEDDAEGSLEDRWTASTPENDSIAPWQDSNSSTPKLRGNQRSSGAKSYWTGVPANRNVPAGEVIQGTSDLTLKTPLRVPKGSPTLVYRSLFQNEGDDRGTVEVASTTSPDDFKAVDTVAAVNTALGETDDKVCDPSQPATQLNGLETRRVDLGAYAGQDVILRFRMSYGPENRAVSQPCGWYIDDLRVSVGSFAPLGESLTTSFDVRDRPKGTYAYRVRGVYSDGVQTAASNEEVVQVTSGGPAGSGGGGGATDPACARASGFTGVRARPRGRRVRLDFARRSLRPARIQVFQTSAGRRVLSPRIVATFRKRELGVTWDGRGPRDKRLRDGVYFARFQVPQADGRIDSRRVTLVRRGGRWSKRPPFYRRKSCRLMPSSRLRLPVFGGRTAEPMRIALQLSRRARVTVALRRGGRTVRKFTKTLGARRRAHRSRVGAAGLPRGIYRVRITARRGGRKVTSVLTTQRL